MLLTNNSGIQGETICFAYLQHSRNAWWGSRWNSRSMFNGKLDLETSFKRFIVHTALELQHQREQIQDPLLWILLGTNNELCY